MQIKEKIKEICIKQLDRSYEKRLRRMKPDYHEWVTEKECKEKTESFSAEVSFVVLYQSRGKLAEGALVYLAEEFRRMDKAQILYGDEDMLMKDGRRANPWYKPAWSPDTYLSQFYPGSVIAVRKALWEEASAEPMIAELIETKCLTKQLSENVEGICFEQPEIIRNVLDRLMEKTGGFKRKCESVQRVPHILFHVSGENVWQDYLGSASDLRTQRANVPGTVSVIIPSKDNVEVLKTCLQALDGLQNIEIVVVDNGSSEEHRREIEVLMKDKKYIYSPMEFNFSRMCNLGAKEANGEYLLFLNDDIEACGKAWLECMKSKASMEYVGAVGLKLYYPGTKKIQHAGITNLPVGPVHKLQFAEDDKDYYFGRNKGEWNCLAVTAACLLIEASKFREAGGFKEELQVAYNDVDLGFALYEAGYQNVMILDEYAYHHESLSRGDDVTRKKRERLLLERTKLYKLHPALLGTDPYYPKELTQEGLDSRIVPGYVNAGNMTEKADWQHCPFVKDELREDKCLMINVEQSTSGIMKGYGVVLGDDNACYDFYVLLSKDEQDLSQAYVCKVNGRYRQDLEENMPDQKNVALCGFAIEVDENAALTFEYQIGMIAVHKISKMRLLNFSGWYLRGKE